MSSGLLVQDEKQKIMNSSISSSPASYADFAILKQTLYSFIML